MTPSSGLEVRKFLILPEKMQLEVINMPQYKTIFLHMAVDGMEQLRIRPWLRLGTDSCGLIYRYKHWLAIGVQNSKKNVIKRSSSYDYLKSRSFPALLGSGYLFLSYDLWHSSLNRNWVWNVHSTWSEMPRGTPSFMKHKISFIKININFTIQRHCTHVYMRQCLNWGKMYELRWYLAFFSF